MEGYERLRTALEPSYWYEEGLEDEKFYVDLQELIYSNEGAIVEETSENKWWVISLYKPIGVKIKNTKKYAKLLKWGVSMSYNDEDIDCEWDFKKHEIKEC